VVAQELSAPSTHPAAGAFTSVCSGKQLPDYQKRAEELQGQGVDAVLCTAVNGERRKLQGGGRALPHACGSAAARCSCARQCRM
jgi:cation transport ATPase